MCQIFVTKITNSEEKMLKKVGLIIILFVFIAITNNAQENRRERNVKREGLRPLIEDLNLSADQKDKFEKINLQKEESLLDLKCQMEKKQFELKKQLTVKPNLENLLKIDSELNEMHKKIREAEIKSWFAVNEILEPSQKELWANHLMMLLNGPNRPPMGPKGEKNNNDQQECNQFPR